jgi:hypothetical protein
LHPGSTRLPGNLCVALHQGAPNRPLKSIDHYIDLFKAALQNKACHQGVTALLLLSLLLLLLSSLGSASDCS